MTIIPLAPMTVAPAATPADGSATPTDASGSGLAGETFAALIAAQLGDPAATTPDVAVPADTDAETDAENEEGTGDGDALVVPAGLALPTTVAPATTPVAGTAADTAADTAEAAAPVDGDEVATPSAPGAHLRGRSAEAPGHTGELPDHASAPAHEHARPGGPDLDALATAPVTDPSAAPQLPLDGPAPAAQTAPAAPAAPTTTNPVVAATVAPVTATDVTPSASAAAPAATVSNPVLDQVTPTFTKMVSGPEGMHRMMLRLHPADLGEIHLTVRVTGDTVDVTVAARPEAREMLVEGSSQLRGLLDSIGRTAHQITFRDLPGTGTTVQVVQGGAGQQPGTTPDGQAGTQYAAPDQGFAGRSGHGNRHNGADGADHLSSSPPDGRPGAPGEPRPTTTTARTAGLLRGGLDVRM